MAERDQIEAGKILVIGGSAGSLDSILLLLPALQEKRQLAVVVIVHRRNGESMLANLLNGKTTWPVKEAEEKEPVRPGVVYVAPADYHLLVERDRSFSLDFSEKVNYSRPSIDVTFETAADAFGPACIALLLSGANQDGTQGLKKIKEAGGYAIVQDPAEALVSYMPQQAIDQVRVDAVVPVAGVPAVIELFLQGNG